MSKSLISWGVAASCFLAACAGNVTTTQGARMPVRSDEFAAYAEAVFRRQNVVLDALSFELEERPDDPRLLLAEDRVLEACAGLNELAVRRRDGGGLRPLRDLRVARRVPACEDAATQAEDVLGLLE